jgi:prepilin-type N-terminal cleavage/methylation domain-containing protein
VPVQPLAEKKAAGMWQTGTGRNESAFTLFELLVVSALISVMLAVAVPTLKNTVLTDPLKTSSRQVIGLIKAVREKAVRDQQPYLITFDLSENSIRFLKESVVGFDDTVEDITDELHLTEPVRILDVWTKSEGRQDTDRQILWVSKQGYIDETMIHLGNDKDEVLSMLFSPFLGKVQITDTYVDLE